MKAQVDWSEDGQRKIVRSGCAHPCPIERGMRLIGGKWKGSILWHLRDAPVRFNDLDRLVAGASKKMLAQRLKEMELDGLLVRQVLNERPVAVSYEITEFGRSALQVLVQLRDWAEARTMEADTATESSAQG